MNRPGQHTFACLDRAVLSIQQAIIGRDDQAGAVGIGHRVFVVQKEVDLEHALDLMALHLPVGPPAPSHRWRRRRAYGHPRALWLTAAKVQTRSIARAILSLGLQVGLRQSEIMRLKVRDLHTTGGYDALRVVRKRGKRDVLVIHPETAQRLRAYLAAAGHGQDWDGPLFRRLTRSGSEQDMRRPLRPERVEWVVRTYTQQIGLGHGYSSHAMRTTFITTALANGAKLEDVQRTVGHAGPATTQLYDRGRFTPQKSAALLVAS